MIETENVEQGAFGAVAPWVVATISPAGVYLWLGQDGLWTSANEFGRVRLFQNLGEARREAVRVKGFLLTIAAAKIIEEKQ